MRLPLASVGDPDIAAPHKGELGLLRGQSRRPPEDRAMIVKMNSILVRVMFF